MSSTRPQRKLTVAVCDGSCHCNDCQFLEPGFGQVFQDNCGRLCKCRSNYIATICWNKDIRCYICYETAEEIPMEAVNAKGLFSIHFFLFLINYFAIL